MNNKGKNINEIINSRADEILKKYLPNFYKETLYSIHDSNQHVITLFSIALACRGKTFIELGVRNGTTTLPILLGAFFNKGQLFSVDVQDTEFQCPEELRPNWKFVKGDAIEFLSAWDSSKKIDFVYIDDWHAYEHVKKELEYLDMYVSPSSIILIHDLMYGNTQPFYHTDLTIKKGQWANGGPYRAVAELDLNFWEWSTLPWNNGLTILRKKYSSKYHSR